jgi:Ca2+-binding RTX toxin-like protein
VLKARAITSAAHRISATTLLVAALASPAHASVTIIGTSGDDAIDVSASAKPHMIYAKSGADTISGSSAADTIDGGSGNDAIFGNDGHDLITGGGGNDFLSGGRGDDAFLVYGTRSSYDEFHGGEGIDSIIGSDGNDVIGFQVEPTSIELIDGRGGYDIIRLRDGGTRSLNLSAIAVLGIELILGGSGHDTIVGSAGDDTMRGGRGNDTLIGGPGRDTASYIGESASYQITWSIPITVRDLVGRDGTDQLTNIEVLAFADGHFENGTFVPLYPDNQAPVAAPDTATVPEGSSAEIDVLANDVDPDGDPFSIVSVGAASYGSVTRLASGNLLYVPRTSFHGVDSFTYRIADNKFGTASGTVTVTVTPLADPPVARADVVSAVAGRPVTIRPLENDTDPDGDAISLQSFGMPLHGTVSDGPDKHSLVYEAPPGFSGKDFFTYTIVDATGRTAAGSVTVDVIGPTSFTELMSVIAASPEGSWVKLNRNLFNTVWVPEDQRQCSAYSKPSRVITAWGSMAFDPNRGDLIFWGGGHANYCGNEVYRFRLSTLMWERASIPSAIHDPLANNQWMAVDGPMNAPTSSHTYDNQEFLPSVDRFITFGGAKINDGKRFTLEDGVTPTGPYLWDPSRADGQKVGGTTGSHSKPLDYVGVFGGQMWDNRNSIMIRGSGTHRPDVSFINGTSAYTAHGGKDAVYVTVHPDKSGKLFRYVVNDVQDPDKDTWELVGIPDNAYTGKGAGAYDSARNFYVRTAGPATSTKILAWNLDNAGIANKSIRISTSSLSKDFPASSLQACGMDYDSVRAAFAIWCTGRDVWYLTPPAVFGTLGWTLTRAAAGDPTGFAPPFKEASGFPGVLGKWKYARRFDVFFGVFEGDTGNVYAYKPSGWRPQK